MSGLRERKKQLVRDGILEICGRLFRSRGFDETTVDEIAREAEISRQTFFNYFPSKEAVLAEIGLVWLRAQGELASRGRRRGLPESTPEGLRQAILDQLAAIEKDRELMRLVFTRSGLFFPHGSHVGKAGDEARLDHTRSFMAAVAARVRVGQKAKRIRRDIDANQIAEMYVAVLVITTRLWLTGYWGERGSLVERGRRALRVLEDGLRARKGSR
ncbi:MAG TPA: TetR family transcriptional regulator [Myxococcota bacterium]|nr:TetR family transcriptional regulator [Myxococcota bacterium]